MTNVTIIITVFNFESYISECLKSIKLQTIQNWKALIIDNGSSDGSVEIIRSFIDDDPRFELHVNKKNTGPYPALNQMLGKVDTPYFTRVDGDDFVEANYLEEAIKCMESNPEVNAIFSNFTYYPSGAENPFPSNINTTKSFSIKDIFGSSLKVEHDYFSGSLSTFFRATTLLKTETIKELGGFEEWRTEADTLMWLKLASIGRVIVIDKPLYHYRKTPGSITASVHEDSEDLFWKKKLWLHLCAFLSTQTETPWDLKQETANIRKEYKAHLLYRLRKKHAWLSYFKTFLSSAEKLD